MWPALSKRLQQFDSGVINSQDSAGYPFSLRCQFSLDQQQQLVQLSLPAHAPLQPGPASLLCHRHDQQLWNQESALVRGKLEQHGEQWILRPTQYIPGIEQNPISFIRFIIGSRQRAAAYLKSRGLARPSIPWEEINQVKREALG
jgi:hypothetical protein